MDRDTILRVEARIYDLQVQVRELKSIVHLMIYCVTVMMLCTVVLVGALVLWS